MTARSDLLDASWGAAKRLAAALRDREAAIKAIKKEAAEVGDYLAMIDVLDIGGTERGLAATKLKEARRVLGDE